MFSFLVRCYWLVGLLNDFDWLLIGWLLIGLVFELCNCVFVSLLLSLSVGRMVDGLVGLLVVLFGGEFGQLVSI